MIKKHILSFFLVISMLVGMFAFAPTANAASAPASITEKEALSKINELISLLDGKYFTVNQKACKTTRESSHGCDNCSNSAIIQAKWFTNLFGEGLSVYQFPTHADYNWGVWNKGAHGGGRSCFGFATFAQWYIFSSKHSDDIEHEIVVQNVDCSYEEVKTNAKPGDVIRTSGHSMIFISCDKNGYRVLDCNGWLSDLNCMVRSKTRQYGGKMAISRASNYDISTNDAPSPTPTTSTKTQYRYYHYTDGTNYSVCAYSGKSKYGTEFYREDTGWLDSPLTMTSNSATSFIHVQQGTACTKAGCTDTSWEGGRYKDSNGVTWYREETRTVKTESAHTHSYNSGTVTKAATCSSSGVKTFTCTGCGATKTENISKKSHSYNGGVITTAATCAKAGVKTYTCEACGATKTESVPKSDHMYVIYAEEIAPTCTEKGRAAIEVCTVCGNERGGNSIPKANHDYSSEWTIDKEATCTETGKKSHRCTMCGTVGSSSTISKLDHTYGEWEIITPAQPGKKGNKARVCVVCGNKDTETIAALPKKSNDNRIIMTIGHTNATVFGKAENSDVAPIIKNDRTMLPARFIAENLGATVSWDGTERKVTVTGSSITIELYIDSTSAYINGIAVTLDSPAFISNDRTYTPVRFIAEALGAKVSWNGDNSQVTITKN